MGLEVLGWREVTQHRHLVARCGPVSGVEPGHKPPPVVGRPVQVGIRSSLLMPGRHMAGWMGGRGWLSMTQGRKNLIN